ncbi:MAG: twin-arginine translocase TatA/TatE family subunit [Deltaproteobacteria bacterium]|nr:twin-arginine translocase TatA/TatE family subunit [Deltaproteobacteria bacterium]
MFGLGFLEIGVILVLALLVFGPKKLPDLARSLGKSIREFRRATEDFRATMEDEVHRPDPAPAKARHLEDAPRALPGPAAALLATPSSGAGSAAGGGSGSGAGFAAAAPSAPSPSASARSGASPSASTSDPELAASASASASASTSATPVTTSPSVGAVATHEKIDA